MTEQESAVPDGMVEPPAALQALTTDIGGVLESMEQVSDYLERQSEPALERELLATASFARIDDDSSARTAFTRRAARSRPATSGLPATLRAL